MQAPPAQLQPGGRDVQANQPGRRLPAHELRLAIRRWRPGCWIKAATAALPSRGLASGHQPFLQLTLTYLRESDPGPQARHQLVQGPVLGLRSRRPLGLFPPLPLSGGLQLAVGAVRPAGKVRPGGRSVCVHHHPAVRAHPRRQGRQDQVLPRALRLHANPGAAGPSLCSPPTCPCPPDTPTQ